MLRAVSRGRNTDTPFEGTEQLTGEKPVTSGSASWIVPAPSKPMIWYGPGGAFVVVGIVVVDAAGIYGTGTHSFKLSLNILEFPVRRVGWTIIVCLPD